MEKSGAGTESESDRTPYLPQYERPKVTVMNDEEVLRAFQMTAAEISSAGCWWSNANLSCKPAGT